MRTSSSVEVKQAVIFNSLRNCRLFAGLPPEDVTAIAAISVVQRVARGGYLFREGEPARGFYIVQTGAINVHRVNALGREQVIQIFRQHESFAEATLATSAGYPAHARAVESSQVLLVHKGQFVDILRQRPELAMRMLAGMSLHLRSLVGQLEDLTLKNVETRLANWLVKRCPDPDGLQAVEVQLAVTKGVLAAELGTVSETFSRTLARFRDQHLIEVKGRCIRVLSPAKLNALLRNNLGG